MGDAVSRTHYEDCWLVCHDCAIAKVKRLQAGINQLRRNLYDEQVRRYEWEKLNNRLIAGTEVGQLQERLGRVSMALDSEVDSRVRAELEVERLQAELALARVKLNRVRQDAQDQSDEVQELWLSPVEAEGLRQQLAKAEALAALVTPELPALLERLANDAEYVSMTDEPYRYMTVQDTETARALAARIRQEFPRRKGVK